MAVNMILDYRSLVTQVELDGFHTLGDIMDWAGMVGDATNQACLRGAFCRTLGAANDTLPRLLGLASHAEFEQIVNLVELVDEGVRTPPNFIQKGQLANVGLVCRIKVGMVPLFQAPVAAPAAPPAIAPLVAAPALGVTLRKVRLSHVIRQGDDSKIELMSERDIQIAHARWETVNGMGCKPDPEEAATDGQLTALQHLVRSSLAPAVDFAVWGPHGTRTERRLRLSGQVFKPDGTFHTVEINGPPTLAHWHASYDVFATAAVMLDIIDLGTLAAYRTFITRMHSRFGPQCWLLIYQAESRFRFEHWQRTQRDVHAKHELAAAAGGTTPYVITRPWNFAMMAGQADAAWWNKEALEPALMMMARSATIGNFIAGDAPIAKASQSWHVQPPNQAWEEHASKKPRKSNTDDKASFKDGSFMSNRRGTELCKDFQTGGCGASLFGTQCPKNRSDSHQCANCLSSQHGKSACKAPTGRVKSDSGKGGKDKGGKGKGNKGKGSGKYSW